ncbi:MAG TPA: exosortase/archaeosortase family protein [Gemmatales bacterium]|nr:exosortase/archaeosortase family protein [Gemmatales bacterium]
MAEASSLASVTPSASASAVTWLMRGGALLLVCVLFVTTAERLGRLWDLDPNYSHGWLVPLAALALAWRRGWPLGTPRPWLGSFEMAAGLVIHLTAVVIPWPLLEFAGLFLMLRGWALSEGGEALARAWLFPSLFLFFMFPLPILWTNALAVWLQEWVSTGSAAVLNVVTVCHRQGYQLTLAGLGEPLVVAEECSGLRQLIAFLALAAVLGELRDRGWAGRLVLVLAAIPAAIGANMARVLLMAAAAQALGIGWLSTWLHDLPALFTLPMGVVLLLAVDWALPMGRREVTTPAPPADPTPPAAPMLPDVGPKLVPVLAVLVVGVGLQLLLQGHLRAADQAHYPSLQTPLAAWPMELTEAAGQIWAGHEDSGNATLAPKLTFADAFINRVYVSNEEAVAVGLYAVHSVRGADREHHPEVCLRDAGGALELVRERGLVALKSNAPMQAQRFVFRQGSQPPLTVYYWHYTFPPVAEARPLSWLQRLHVQLRQRPPSLTVQVTAAAPTASQRAVIEERFLPLVHTTWMQHLPPGVRVGHDRLPIRLVHVAAD